MPDQKKIATRKKKWTTRLKLASKISSNILDPAAKCSILKSVLCGHGQRWVCCRTEAQNSSGLRGCLRNRKLTKTKKSQVNPLAWAIFKKMLSESGARKPMARA